MEENKFIFPNLIGAKYTLRSTGEEVEIITYNQPEVGARSEDDWVTYLDAHENEHIKEKLNFQLDFKPVVNNLFDKILNDDWKKGMPSTMNQRVFDIAKSLVVDHQYKIKVAIDVAMKLVSEINDLGI